MLSSLPSSLFFFLSLSSSLGGYKRRAHWISGAQFFIPSFSDKYTDIYSVTRSLLFATGLAPTGSLENYVSLGDGQITKKMCDRAVYKMEIHLFTNKIDEKCFFLLNSREPVRTIIIRTRVTEQISQLISFGRWILRICLFMKPSLIDAQFEEEEENLERREQGRIHNNPVADGWAGAVMQKPLGIQNMTDRPTDRPTYQPTDRHGKV